MRFTSGESDEAIEPTKDDELVHSVESVNELAAELARVSVSYQHAREHLLKVLDRLGQHSAYVEVDGRMFKTTAVRSEQVKIDAEGLQKALGKRAWNKLTKRVIDKDLLTAAVAEGSVPASVAAEHLTVVPRASYPKITEVEGAPQE